MNKHKISSSPQTVPFSWEYLPGVSKVAPKMDENPKPILVHRAVKLPPPPISSPHVSPRNIPLPPCQFRPNQTKKDVTQPEEDPFLAAYIECTKPVKNKEIPDKIPKKTVRRNSWPRIERLGISCKSSCSVREGNLIKVSKLPELDQEIDFEW